MRKEENFYGEPDPWGHSMRPILHMRMYDSWVNGHGSVSCWERLKAGGEGDNRGWDGWMASRTRWTWVWASFRIWWWTGKPGVLQSMGLQRVGIQLSNWTELCPAVGGPWWNWATVGMAFSKTARIEILKSIVRTQRNYRLPGSLSPLSTLLQHSTQAGNSRRVAGPQKPSN